MLGFLTLETVKLSLYKRLDLFSLSVIQTDDENFHYYFLIHKGWFFDVGFCRPSVLLLLVVIGLVGWLVGWVCLFEGLRLKSRALGTARK